MSILDGLIGKIQCPIYFVKEEVKEPPKPTNTITQEQLIKILKGEK